MMLVPSPDAGYMTSVHAATMMRRLLENGVVRITCENVTEHNKEPYARFYWNAVTVLEKFGFRVRSKLVGSEHIITLVPMRETLQAILDHLERLGR